MTPRDLLPRVYDELRKLAAAKLLAESPGHSLDATALVHEAWLRIDGESFSTRSGFFRASAVAMRRILVDHARSKKAAKRGGEWLRADFDPQHLPSRPVNPDVEAIDAALEQLAATQPQIAELVQLRYFLGMTIPEAAAVLDISPRTANAWWAYARGWLGEELKK